MNDLEKTYRKILDLTNGGKLCPAHNDQNPSLKVTLTENRILLHCHAGCKWREVMQSLGMNPGELSTNVKKNRNHLDVNQRLKAKLDSEGKIHFYSKKYGREVIESERYNYLNPNETIAFSVIRSEPKDFRPLNPDGHLDLMNIEQIPYKLPELCNSINKNEPVFVCEGERDADRGFKEGVCCTTFQGGTGKWRKEFEKYFKDSDVVLIPDNDEAGRNGMKIVAQGLSKVAKRIRILELQHLPENGDLSDWFDIEGNDKTKLLELADKVAKDWLKDRSSIVPKLKILSVYELLEMEVPEMEFLLKPILREQGTGMLWAYRGVGKTWMALGMAAAIASGRDFLCWKVPKPSGVLYIDGELPLKGLKDRVGEILSGSSKDLRAPFHILTPDVQDFGLPDISTEEGQEAIEEFISDDIKIVFLDNISTLVHSGVENDAESWLPMQQWALKLRRKGKAVLFIHHGNKKGNQRGTSRREDILDVVIKLQHGPNYSQESGAEFEVHYEKARGIFGEDSRSFEAKLFKNQEGKMDWSWRLLEETNYEKIINLINLGLSVKDIAGELDISLTAVYNHKNKGVREGRINKDSTIQPP